MRFTKHTPKTDQKDQNNRINGLAVLVFQVHYEDYNSMSYAKANFQRGLLDTTLLDSEVYFFARELYSSVDFLNSGPSFNLANITAYEVFGDPLEDGSEWRFVKDYEF